MANQNVCTKTIDEINRAVIFAFSNGETITVYVDQFSQTIRDRAMLYGICETLGNAYAGSKGSSTFAMAKFNARLTALKGGNWHAKSGGGILALAVARATEKDDTQPTQTVEDCIARIALLDDAAKKALRAGLKLEIAEIELERAKGSDGAPGRIDVAGLFND